MATRERSCIATRIFILFVLFALLVGLPLLGVVMDGKSVNQYTEFPPLTRYVVHAPFSWSVFIALAAFTIAIVAPFVLRVVRARPADAADEQRSSSFPWWGWAGFVFGAGAWILAWTRFDWLAPLQHFTFSPLWFAYIVVVNACRFRRTGHCMLLDRPAYFALLFGASAAFWWFFEFLNRFVQNWYYIGVQDLSPFQYVLLATLPFSTVLPAVMGTYELLTSFPRLVTGLDNWVRIDIFRPKLAGGAVLIFSSGGLMGIGVWPDLLFPLLWVAPLFIITSLQVLRGRPTIFSALRRGDWQRIWLLALSALICGFFWEMWNYFSLAKWQYAVPFVNRFHLFEMPLLGYAGYLPFGLECAVVADAVWAWLKGRFDEGMQDR